MTIHVSQDMISSVKHPITGERSHITRVSVVNDVTRMHVQFISYGATIYSLKVADDNGRLKDVVMGFELIQDYEARSNPYFGSTIGRVCNRIAYGSVFIYGQEYQLTTNHGINHLHGGNIGFDKIPWNVKEIHDNGVTFCHRSPHDHEGYPGELFATVRYTVHEDNSVRIYMTAKTTMPTVVNMTNHSYFNLAGHDAGKNGLYDHNVFIFAREITVTNDQCIPTGETMPVKNTPYDFRCGDNLGHRIRQIGPEKLGYDNYFCVIRDGLSPKDLARVAKVIHPPTGLWMEVYSNQLGVQFYTANHLPDERKGEEPLKGRRCTYQKHGAFCLETHGYPDAPNHIHFPSILLRPGELYEHWVNYKFGTMKNEAPITRLSELDDIDYVNESIGDDNTECLEDEVYENVPVGAERKSQLASQQAAESANLLLEKTAQLLAQQLTEQAVQQAAHQTEQPQSSGAIRKQEPKETGAIKKQTGAIAKITGAIRKGTVSAAAVAAAVVPMARAKPVEKAKPKAEHKGNIITVKAIIEKEPKKDLKKDPNKYKAGQTQTTEFGAGTSAGAGARAAETQGKKEEKKSTCCATPKERY